MRITPSELFRNGNVLYTRQGEKFVAFDGDIELLRDMRNSRLCVHVKSLLKLLRQRAAAAAAHRQLVIPTMNVIMGFVSYKLTIYAGMFVYTVSR